MTTLRDRALQAAADANGGYIDRHIVRIVEAGLTVCIDRVHELESFLGQVQGVSLGVAMSGKDHPNPDGVLMDLFRKAQELGNKS
jgi:hypothetical protein